MRPRRFLLELLLEELFDQSYLPRPENGEGEGEGEKRAHKEKEC